MAKYIDIKDFEGALTNADLEDLPENVAQEIKNLKIQAGKLEKTFGAGTPSGIPTIGLSFVNTKLGTTYTVYNIYTFISEYFTGNSNDAGDGYRYLLVTIGGDNKVKLWWYDPSLPDVNDHLQIENDVVWFQTAGAHGIVEDDFVLVQDCKDNASPQASISGAGVYEQADHIPSTAKVGVNTDNARTWGGKNFFDTALATGASNKNWGGKHSTHVLVSDTVGYGGTPWPSVQKIAIAPMSSSVGRVLSIANNGTELAFCATGSTYANLNTANYNSYKSKSNFAVCGLISFNEAIYIHYSFTDSGSQNKLVKYTCTSGGSVLEGTPVDISTSGLCVTSFMTVANNHLYILAKNLGLFKVTTSDNVTSMSISGITIGDATGLTSIVQTNRLTANGSVNLTDVNHEYLVVVTTNSTLTTNVYTLDILSSETSFTAFASPISTADVQNVTKMDFGENTNRSESIVLYYIGASNRRYIQYSSHTDSTIISSLTNNVDSSTFPITLDITFIDNAMNVPSGEKYLIVGTDNIDTGTATSGKLYRVNSNKNSELMIDPGTTTGKTNWSPSCFADCATPQNFFTYAKAWIGVYGTEAEADDGSDSADVYKMSDIGWFNNSWNGSGDCEYRWIDIMDSYSIAEIDTSNVSSVPDIYHKAERNPIVPSGDNIRFIPGAVGKISNTEAKGIWLGYINRSLFNGLVSADPNWFIYANKLNNPFRFTSTRQYNTGDTLRPGSTVKYNLTAVYDGLQESLFDKDKEIVLSDSNVNKKIIELSIEFDASALNKRITGVNIYRATEFSNTTSFDGYSNYQLIGHMTFVDSQTSLPTVTSDVITRLHAWGNHVIFIKDTDDLTSFDGETLGRNPYALDVDGGFDGIDEMLTWRGATSSSTQNRADAFLVFHSLLARQMNVQQTCIVLSSLTTDNTIANADKIQIEDESITIDDTSISSSEFATVKTGVGVTTSVYQTSGSEVGVTYPAWRLQTITDTSVSPSTALDATPFIVQGDVLRTSATSATTETLTVQKVTTSYIFASSNATSMGSPAQTTYTADYNLCFVSVASGALCAVSRGQAPITNPSPADNTTAVSHNVNTPVSVRAESLPRSFSQARLDSNADVGDNYLDNGTMAGSDWKIREKKLTGGYEDTSQTSSSGGAYGGPSVAFLYFYTPDDITGTLGTDTTGNTLTASSLAGSVLITNYTNEQVDQVDGAGNESTTSDQKAFLIENNSAYEPTLGGCWVKLNKGHRSTAQRESGKVFENVRLLSGFKRTNAQGATTPGMAFETVSGTTVRIVCQDFRLEDLGETDIQTVYSNRVNAQYAVKLKGRLFLGNLVLNPDDKQEEHHDWIAYSELHQYDNRPVSNVIALDDREGGEVTGLAVLFGRLVIFKPQAIFIMNVPNPANPESWSVVESKHSIGNIASEGVVEIHDHVYFVFHDGIYAVTPNMVASSTATPSVMEKITLPIEDQFLLATSKKDIKGVYDQDHSEVLYTWTTGSPATQVVWAYHVVLKTWRKVETTTNLDILAYGENSYPIAWDNTDSDIKKFDVDEAVGVAWKSKTFRMDLDKKRLIRYGMIQFTGTDTLTVNLYLDGSGSASFTKTITADGGVNRFPIKRYGKKFEIELTTPSSTNPFSVERMRIETE
jgi:hypothetical protein|tara:strand:- start:9166 stop:14052 length:4887 start_codon:yes stop_codon:yes gene_type:complete